MAKVRNSTSPPKKFANKNPAKRPLKNVQNNGIMRYFKPANNTGYEMEKGRS
jgi:hypothetical protein